MLGSGLGSNMLDSGVAIPVWLRGWEAMLQQWALELEVFGGTCVKKEVSAQLYHLGPLRTKAYSMLLQKSHHTADSMAIHLRVLWFSDGPVILLFTLLSAYRFC